MKRLLPIVCLGLAATPAAAHVPAGAYGSFAAGFTHPLFGLDHLLAMVTVGLWAGLLGGRAVWAVPTAFVAVMIAGFALALSGASLPVVEPMILASTVVLGLAVAFAVRVDLRVCAVVVGVFALFHGFAHGTELGGAGALRFGAGFVLATVLLHALGVAIGLLAGRIAGRNGGRWHIVTRGLGTGVAVAGVVLAFG
ncbi:HupE / UreJ protein [Oceaniovalibus guishaninsula JLT2003]|uniref:HupE / UreJ protein n=1 Tax=Oceaniovalibus guishaninsula JLT2003 TaxID=1231392 RepID=K2H992_9RHOB|nr:HupE/UreJ family protein [Oceaniovalibus guishaninsula]EKE43147.1 HupE / UreJ protein [Oceaniovalibus guishaninsula JLT2003]